MPGGDTRPIVLVVDDEQSVMRLITSTLANAGYRVVTAENGKAGLEIFERQADEIRMIIADIAMPVMGGITMAERILALRPDSKILLMTGYSETIVGESSKKLPLIRKPFLPSDLVRKIKGLLENGPTVKGRGTEPRS